MFIRLSILGGLGHFGQATALSVLVKAASVPIDRHSGEQIDQLKETEVRCKLLRQIRDAASLIPPRG